MSYTETTTRSWFARLRNALVGLVLGPLLVLASILLLAWNESRAIETWRALNEGAGLVIEVSSDAPDAANDGRLVHVAGPVTPGGVPEDPDFAIRAEGAVGLSRTVEMYQWVEKQDSKTEKKLGGGEETVTTYSYSKDWLPSREKSEDFKQQDGHQNPDMPVVSQSFAVPDARIGSFAVEGEPVADLGERHPLQLSDDDARRFADFLGSGSIVTRRNGGLYAGRNPSEPSVGDLRISYARADLKDASVVAEQKNGALVAYKASNGHEIFLTAAGIQPADRMFRQAEQENTIITWAIRAGGLVLMLIGFSVFFSILGVIADFIPLFGSVVGFGTGMVSLTLTLLLGPVVIAISWFAVRPVLALSIVAGGVALAGLFWYLRRGKPATAGQTVKTT